MKIILASNNKGKIKEIKEIYKEFEVFSIMDIEQILNKKIVVTEEQDSFEGNALEKCRCLYNVVKNTYKDAICIADDSGLSIDGLNGFPGVHTARWMDANDHIKNIELLKRLDGKDNRKCHYTNSIALIKSGVEKICNYTLDGNISEKCRGENGFGFDEIFQLENGLTLAELSSEEKYKVSPRTNSLEMMKKVIKSMEG